MLHLEEEWFTKQSLDYVFWLVPDDGSNFLTAGGTSSSEDSSTMLSEF